MTCPSTNVSRPFSQGACTNVSRPFPLGPSTNVFRPLPLGAKEDELDPLPWLNVSALISLTAVICPVIIFKIVKRRLIPNLDFLQALVIIKKKFCHPLILIFKWYFLISYVKAQFPKILTSKQTKRSRLREAPHNNFKRMFKWNLAVSRGGTYKTKVNFLMVPRWILLSLQYIRTGGKEFLNLVSVLTLHIDPQYLTNHYIRVKYQNCRRPMVWPIKTCARRALSQRKKN